MNKKIILSTVCLALFLLVPFYAKAQSKNILSATLSPDAITQKTGDVASLSLTLEPQGTTGISGYDVCLGYDNKSVEFVSIAEPKDDTGSGSKFTKLKNLVNNPEGETCASYVAILPDDKLPKKVTQLFTIKGLTPSEGQIQVKKAQIVGNVVGNEYQIESTVTRYNFSGSAVAAGTTQATSSNPITSLFTKLMDMIRSMLGMK